MKPYNSSLHPFASFTCVAMTAGACLLLTRSASAQYSAAPAAAAPVAAAQGPDSILMKDGRSFSGTIQSATTNGVNMLIGQNQMTVPRNLISDIHVVAPAAIQRGIKAYEGNLIKEAVMTLEKSAPAYLGLDVEWEVKAIVYLARAYMADKNYAAAEKYFQIFLDCYPGDPLEMNAKVGLASIAMVQNKTESALEQFKELAEPYDKMLKPEGLGIDYAAESYVGIGRCYEALNKETEALDSYLVVIALYPSEKFYPQALYRGGLMAAKLGKLERADSMLSELIEDYPVYEFSRNAIQERSNIRTKLGAQKAKDDKGTKETKSEK